ncbi:hypothetical protein Pelo_16395 [Pelomyxa schiedti]|nr:hypothetical protein Pelo_16395 [Pelomyxa schiedti]
MDGGERSSTDEPPASQHRDLSLPPPTTQREPLTTTTPITLPRDDEDTSAVGGCVPVPSGSGTDVTTAPRGGDACACGGDAGDGGGGGGGDDHDIGKLRSHLEWLLSPPQLRDEPLLLSRLTLDYCIPLPDVASHVGESETRVEEAIRSSSVIHVKEQIPSGALLVKVTEFPGTSTNERKELVIRDVPAAVTRDDIEKLFEDVAEVKDATPDVCDSWRVLFQNEKALMAAFDSLWGKKLLGSCVRAFVKNPSKPRTVQPFIPPPRPPSLSPPISSEDFFPLLNESKAISPILFYQPTPPQLPQNVTTLSYSPHQSYTLHSPITQMEPSLEANTLPPQFVCPPPRCTYLSPAPMAPALQSTPILTTCYTPLPAMSSSGWRQTGDSTMPFLPHPSDVDGRGPPSLVPRGSSTSVEEKCFKTQGLSIKITTSKSANISPQSQSTPVSTPSSPLNTGSTASEAKGTGAAPKPPGTAPPAAIRYTGAEVKSIVQQVLSTTPTPTRPITMPHCAVVLSWPHINLETTPSQQPPTPTKTT